MNDSTESYSDQQSADAKREEVRDAASAPSKNRPSTNRPPGGESPNAASYIVGVGASAGGLEALERLFEFMPDDTGMAFVVVQHLSPDFRSLMGEVLGRWTKMPVLTAQDGTRVAANTIYLMPPRAEMIISDGKLLLKARDRSGELRLPIDQFLRSLARDAGPRSVAIVLSGTGSDGSRGIRDIHDAGGRVLVQSPETAKFDGMPNSALETSVADETLAPEEMPAALMRMVHHPRATDTSEDETGGMQPVFRLLRERSGIDFSYYKPTTVARRTEHRMQLCRAHDLESYIRRLQEDEDELDALYRDLLIGVTSFFRDPEAFASLEHDVLPKLLAPLNPGDEFRAWVAGCATGQEAYSLAMLLHEQIQASGKRIHAKVFATDVHERSLEIAAAGCYGDDAVASIPQSRLDRFFTRVDGGFRVKSDLRNMVVFAVHNIIKDAPFTRMNLIACRNLLIYLVPTAQSKALSLFHFGLKTGAVLFLGPSENSGELKDEFELIQDRWKIFRKRRDAKFLPSLRLPLSTGRSAHWNLDSSKRDPGLPDLFSQILDEALPPSVLLSTDYMVLHTFGDVGKLLRVPKGAASLNIMEMLQGELRLAVGAALHRASRDKSPVTLSRVSFPVEDETMIFDVTVTPLPPTRRTGPHMLVRFEQTARHDGSETRSDLGIEEAARDHISSLEAELRFAKENLQATIEELETSNEELQATNEELLASNEELQSTNEELHSVNEELYTVNFEYQRKIEELTQLTHDMDNLLDSTDIHTIFLDENLRIRRFTPKMAAVFHIIDADLGRPIHGFMHSIQCADLTAKLAKVVDERRQYEEEVQNSEGETFLMRILPYRGDPDQSGVVMTLIDVTNLKAAESRFQSALEVSPNGILMVSSQGGITQVNSEVEQIFGYSRSELVGMPLETLIATEMRDQHRSQREEYFQDPYVIRRMGDLPYVWGLHRDGRRIPLDVHVRPIATPHGKQAIASVVDVSRHQQLEESLREQVTRRDRFLATLSHELRNPMGAILTAASVLNAPGAETPELDAACDVIRRQASRMSRLLDDLLDVARVTQGKITLRMELVDLVEACRNSVEAVRPMIEAHRHQCQTRYPEQPVWVRADRIRLVQVIENLLTNAIKYTDDTGLIEVVVSRRGSRAIVSVRDNGRGMPPELIETIFDMFVQSDETLDRSDGGMGVGLTLVRSLLQMQDGTIEARSAGPGQGSEFVVELPLAEPPTARSTQLASARTGDSTVSTRLILVEDDDDARDMLASLLRRYGQQVLATASDGLEGFDKIMQLRPEVAILDIGLPKLDGYALGRKLREQLGDQIYLIAVTGYGRNEDRETVIESGFDQHLVKPVEIKQLVRLLQSRRKKT